MVRTLSSLCIPNIPCHDKIFLPLELYFNDINIWKRCKFNDLKQKEFDNCVKIYWNDEYPWWLTSFFIVEFDQLQILKYVKKYIDFSYELKQYMIQQKRKIMLQKYYQYDYDY